MTKTYSEDEVQLRERLAAAEAKNDEMRGHMKAMGARVFENHKALKDGIEKLTSLLSNHNDKMIECRKDLRNEIDRDFLSIQVYLEEKGKIEKEIGRLESKIDKLNIKITTTVAVVMIIINFAFKYFG